MTVGNPAFAITAAEIEPSEEAISHCVAIGHAIRAMTSRTQRPEDMAELLEIAAHAAVLKHMAQQQRDKTKLTS